MKELPLRYRLECLVLASDAPLSIRKAVHLLGDISDEQLAAAVGELNEENIFQGRSFTVEQRGGVLVARTREDFAELLASLRADRRRLTPSLLHTLAVVAYQQPATKAQVDQVRGVDCGYALTKLLKNGLVCIAGRAEKPGRPLLYRTTEQFLIRFGLRCLDELPRLEELKALLSAGAATEDNEAEDTMRLSGEEG